MLIAMTTTKGTLRVAVVYVPKGTSQDKTTKRMGKSFSKANLPICGNARP